MWSFERVVRRGILKQLLNVDFQKSDEMCPFKGVIKFALLKGWSNVHF